MHSFLSEKESCQRTQLQTKEGQGTLCSRKTAIDGPEDNNCTETPVFWDLKEQMISIHVNLSFIVTFSMCTTIAP